MKAPNIILLFVCLAAPLCAFAPHPSVLMVKVGEQMAPVVKVIGTDPVAMVDGAEKRVRTSPIYVVERADNYTRGIVRLSKVQLSTSELKNVASAEDAQNPATMTSATEGGRFGTIYFDATLTSKHEVNGGFAAVVIYSGQNAEIIVHDLPNLPAGVAVPIHITGPIPDRHVNPKYFIQIFDGAGREVMTNGATIGWEYYSKRDHERLAAALRKYRAQYAGADHAAVPMVMPKPVLSDSLPPPKGPVTALVTVEPDGTVSKVEVSGVDDPNARQGVVDALSGWLFLPRLKAGVPVAAKLQVPLQF